MVCVDRERERRERERGEFDSASVGRPFVRSSWPKKGACQHSISSRRAPPRAPLNALQSISLTLQTCRETHVLPLRAARGPRSTRRRCRSTAKKRSSAQFCLRPRLSAVGPPPPVSSPPSMLAGGRARVASRAPHARGSHVRARSCRRRYGGGSRSSRNGSARGEGRGGGEVDF